MNKLLTLKEYQAIAKKLRFVNNAFIDGRFQKAKSGKIFATINPANQETLCQIAACQTTEVNLAVSKARQVFESGDWSKMHPSQRKTILIRWAKLIKRKQLELAVLESLDSGKPIRDCQLIDLPESINTLIWHAEAIDKIYDQTAPSGDDALAIIVREAIGVVACVLPWNFPLLMLMWKVAPALAAGNSVIVKPAEQTSLTALAVAELSLEAGLPNGVFNVITGDGPNCGEPLGRHLDVDMVSFTGSTSTGKRFLHYAADSNLKKVVLECGGKNAAIVLEDAENLDLVASHIVNGAFWNMGQNCSAISRLIVAKKIKQTLLKKIKQQLKHWSTGNPLDPKNYLGTLIEAEHFEKVQCYLKQIDKKNIIVGGQSKNQQYIMPTIVDNVTATDAIAREEVFGPVLSVMTVHSLDEAITLANQTCYGLTASIFSVNGKKALNAAKALKAGTVTVNCYGEGDITTPFGGYKQSGFAGRDNGLHAHDQYTELKTIWLDLSDDNDQSLDANH